MKGGHKMSEHQVMSTPPVVTEEPKVVFSKTMAGFLLMFNGILFKVDRDKKDPKRSTFIFKHDERLDDSLASYHRISPILKAIKYGDDVLIDKILKVIKDEENDKETKNSV